MKWKKSAYHAAVDGDDLARDVVRIRPRKERHALGDILRRSEALQRDRFHIRIPHVFRQYVCHLGP